MVQFNSPEDTIAAISTPPGIGGIGIVRMSGADAVRIADCIFVGKNRSGRVRDFKSFTVHYGCIVRQDNSGGQGKAAIDEVLLTVMRAPNSYTKEDVVEISCHGGMVSLRAILNLALEKGARLAEPGEFTKRAFLNGRIDLTQAEAVLDVINAKTDAFLRVSTNQLRGELRQELDLIRGDLLGIYTELEALVNFPEDGIEDRGKKIIFELTLKAKKRIERLIDTSDQGRILREGARVVICGRPNVGKSLLLNVLLRQPRAIVSDIEGTTRDTIEEPAQIKDVPFQLVDTAGILLPRDAIEQEAVERSEQSIKRADLILFVLDASSGLRNEDEELIETVRGRNVIAVLNKTDLPRGLNETDVESCFSGAKSVAVSALTKQGIEALEEAILENLFGGRIINTHEVCVSNVRHAAALKRCRASVATAEEQLCHGHSIEFISEEIKAGIKDLDSITGRDVTDDLLDKIFSEFCIGK